MYQKGSDSGINLNNKHAIHSDVSADITYGAGGAMRALRGVVSLFQHLGHQQQDKDHQKKHHDGLIVVNPTDADVPDGVTELVADGGGDQPVQTQGQCSHRQPVSIGCHRLLIESGVLHNPT